MGMSNADGNRIASRAPRRPLDLVQRPICRMPTSMPERLNAPTDVLATRLVGVMGPPLLLAGAESWMVVSTEEMASRHVPAV